MSYSYKLNVFLTQTGVTESCSFPPPPQRWPNSPVGGIPPRLGATALHYVLILLSPVWHFECSPTGKVAQGGPRGPKGAQGLRRGAFKMPHRGGYKVGILYESPSKHVPVYQISCFNHNLNDYLLIRWTICAFDYYNVVLNAAMYTK